MKLDPAVAELLNVNVEDAQLSSAGGGGCSAASTSKVTCTSPDGKERVFFLKTGSGKAAEIMFEGGSHFRVF